MVLTPSQKQIAKDTHRFRVLNCGRRFGKTTEAVEEIKGYVLAGNEGEKIAYIAPTYQQARDIAWEMLLKELRPLILSKNEARLELTIRNQQSKPVYVVLRGWESIETLRGQKFKFIVLDEVAMMRNFWIGWQEVLRPSLTDLKGHALFISTPKGFNHFYDLYNIQDKDPDFKSFHFTTYDNPFIPKEEIDKARQELTEDRFAQEYLADFRKSEGLVYKEFLRDIHVTDASPNNVKSRFAGIDFGYTNPTAIIVIEEDNDSMYWVREEWYKTQRTGKDIADYVETLKLDIAYPDPENPEHVEALRKRGIAVAEVNKDIIKGVDSVRALFKNHRIKIHPSCKNLISELETYHYEEKRPDKNETEKPVKDKDHAVDALRYALFMCEPIQSESQEVDFNLYSQAEYH